MACRARRPNASCDQHLPQSGSQMGLSLSLLSHRMSAGRGEGKKPTLCEGTELVPSWVECTGAAWYKCGNGA